VAPASAGPGRVSMLKRASLLRLATVWPMSSQRVPGGVVHKLPADLRKALIANTTALDAWKDITPLARNEFICWVEDAKQEMTRERRIRRTQEELEEGQRRPCCWPGCKHRERNGR
jgi:Bacteriocin-protection, YdeI or OmpD-Associated